MDMLSCHKAGSGRLLAAAAVAPCSSGANPANYINSPSPVLTPLQTAYDVRFGARPLRRWLEQHVVTALSRMIISGELQEGGSVLVDVDRCAPFVLFCRSPSSEHFPRDKVTLAGGEKKRPKLRAACDRQRRH